jgi:hypothetical protein
MSEAPGWDGIKRSLRVGTLVKGTVIRHAPFGVFVRIGGIPFDGLVQITDFKDEGRMTVDEFPPIGSLLTALVLGFKETGNQIWLGVKPSQVGTVDRPGKGYVARTAIPVGLRVQPDGVFEFFGIEEVNSLVREGARVIGLEPGDAIMTKVGEADESVRLRLGGFSVRVVIEHRAGDPAE